MSDTEIKQAKQAVRERVWALLEREGVVAPGVHGHIPNFVGADQAAERLAEQDVWKRARVIMANPDRAQLPVRVRALREGKIVYMAVPNLAGPKPFYLLDPTKLTEPFEQVATGSGAAKVAPMVDVGEMQPVDLIVCGSVAVNREGVRLGKGAGYSDTEVALLTESGLVSPKIVAVTTVHRIQALDQRLPEAIRDFRLDLVVTPDETIESGRSRTLP